MTLEEEQKTMSIKDECLKFITIVLRAAYGSFRRLVIAFETAGALHSGLILVMCFEAIHSFKHRSNDSETASSALMTLRRHLLLDNLLSGSVPRFWPCT